jgi:hypothetical protein
MALLILPSFASAAPPTLTASSPLGAPRGHATEVTLRGTGLGDSPRLVAPFAFQLDESAGSGSDASRWKFRLTIDDRTAVGVYPIRVATESGASGPVLFAVGQVAQAAEIEPNNTIDGAQPIANPSVVEGECSGNDEDFFRFKGRKDMRIVVDAVCSRIGSGVDPMIRLTKSDGRFIASADDTPGLLTDGYLTAVLPEDGDYVLELCDSRFAGSGRAVYRLLIGAVPFAGELYPMVLPRGQLAAIELRGGTLSDDRLFALRTPADPLLVMCYPSIPARLLGDPAWADSELDVELPAPVPLFTGIAVLEPTEPAQKLSPLTPPLALLGRLSKPGERDEFTIKAPPGSKYEVRMEAWGLGSALDGQLRILDKGGRLLGESDDGKGRPSRRAGGGARARGPVTTDPAYDLTMPPGQDQVTIVVKDLMDRGGVGFPYRLIVEPADAAFQLTLDDDQVAIPRGGTALIRVNIARGGYTGPIDLDIRGLRPQGGVTAIPGVIPASQALGLVGLKADLASRFDPQDIQVVGKGSNGQTVAAARTIVFAQQTISTPGFGMSGTIPGYWRRFVSLTAAVTRPGPIALNAGEGKLVVPQGGTVEVPVHIVRDGVATANYQIVALAPPAGLSVTSPEVGKSTTNAAVRVTAAADASLGRVTLGLVATPAGRKDAGPPSSASAIASALIPVEVVRPAGGK